MADKKGGLGRVLPAKLGALASKLPFGKRGAAATPEPFSEIEDDTPLGDLLSSENAAPIASSSKPGQQAGSDLRDLLGQAIRKPPVLIGALSLLVLILAFAAVALIVAAPPKANPGAPAFTKEGEAVVKAWPLPPGDPLEPRLSFERDSSVKYSAADAARIGLRRDPIRMAGLSDSNDEMMEDLYGTVP
jgi:hypothetical protein